MITRHTVIEKRERSGVGENFCETAKRPPKGRGGRASDGHKGEDSSLTREIVANLLNNNV